MSSIVKYLLILPFIMAAACGCGGCGAAPGSPTRITIVSYGGGAYHDSQKAVYHVPFEQISGIQVEPVVWNAEYGKFKSMVDSGRISWDVVEVPSAQYTRGKKENLFDKIDPLPSADSFIPGSVSDAGVAHVYWATAFAYSREKFSTRAPASWRDFWDVTGYPGPRALHDDPRCNLEFALLADGVLREKLYPLDVDRAFRKLDEIKPHVRVWWTDGTQPVQLLLTNQVAVSSVWNGRVYGNEKARADLKIAWQGAAHDVDYWVIPRGCPNRVAASRFIFFASEPGPQAKQAELIGYGPANKLALRAVADHVKTHLPTTPDNWDLGFVVNSMWWSENEDEMKARWLTWKQK
jgi:putative spermidine/putrescine transport system substrate-binding protein